MTGVLSPLLTALRAPAADFSQPPGEPALVGPDSVSWQVFKNPVSLFIGGVAAVLLELAEPRVRTGVWEHTTFRTDPIPRMVRTGVAAMITVYGARSQAERMIAGVVRRHGRVTGATPVGTPYAANDPALLDWVQATASFGFLEAYHAYVRPLTDADKDRFYAEGEAAGALYGAVGAPRSLEAQGALFTAMLPALEASEIVFEFLDIMRRAPILPWPLQGLQWRLIRAGTTIVPAPVRERLALGTGFTLTEREARSVRRLGSWADRIAIPGSPPVRACRRLGLPGSYLHRGPVTR